MSVVVASAIPASLVTMMPPGGTAEGLRDRACDDVGAFGDGVLVLAAGGEAHGVGAVVEEGRADLRRRFLEGRDRVGEKDVAAADHHQAGPLLADDLGAPFRVRGQAPLVVGKLHVLVAEEAAERLRRGAGIGAVEAGLREDPVAPPGQGAEHDAVGQRAGKRPQLRVPDPEQALGQLGRDHLRPVDPLAAGVDPAAGAPGLAHLVDHPGPQHGPGPRAHQPVGTDQVQVALEAGLVAVDEALDGIAQGLGRGLAGVGRGLLQASGAPWVHHVHGRPPRPDGRRRASVASSSMPSPVGASTTPYVRSAASRLTFPSTTSATTSAGSRVSGSP